MKQAAQTPQAKVPPAWLDDMEEVIARFGCDGKDLVEALKASPNARGYVHGAVTELLLKKHLEKLGFEVKRIKEKWRGKDKKHYADLYVRRDGGPWFLVESKGLKTNSERWHKLRVVVSSAKAIQTFFDRRSRGTLGLWWKGLTDERRKAVLESQEFSNARVLETHLVATKSKKSGRTMATPRQKEFHILALDLFRRTGTHEFIFAVSKELEPGTKRGHLKQNYIIDVLVEPGARPVLPAPWSTDFKTLFERLDSPIDPDDMQVDKRKPGEWQTDDDGDEDEDEDN